MISRIGDFFSFYVYSEIQGKISKIKNTLFPQFFKNFFLKFMTPSQLNFRLKIFKLGFLLKVC